MLVAVRTVVQPLGRANRCLILRSKKATRLLELDSQRSSIFHGYSYYSGNGTSLPGASHVMLIQDSVSCILRYLDVSSLRLKEHGVLSRVSPTANAPIR